MNSLSAPFQSLLHQSPLSLLRPLSAHFSTSASTQSGYKPISAVKKRKRGQIVTWDRRITAIQHHLFHPRIPRVLRLSRNRYMRHWTIDTAWKLFSQKQKNQQKVELQKQWQAMSNACEQLRILGDDGVEGGEHTGRRYRECMTKTGIWDHIPIEYARCITDWPSRNGWNHEWKRL
jgi:large subunit ribosomal protein L40